MEATEETRTVKAEEIARAFHEEYEAAAGQHGWETQDVTRTSFDDLPEENRRTMVATVQSLLGRGVISVQRSTQEWRSRRREIEAECGRSLATELLADNESLRAGISVTVEQARAALWVVGNSQFSGVEAESVQAFIASVRSQGVDLEVQ
jgi:hypothetical protein